MNNEETIFQAIRKIVADKLEMNEEEITSASDFRKDLRISSIVIVSIVLAIETHFNIEIADEEIVSIVTVGDAVRFVSRKIEPKGADNA